MAQIVAEELGVGLEDITVTNADTEITPWDLGQWASRTATIGGSAVLAAAKDAKGQMFKIAAKMLDTTPENLFARDGKIHVQNNPTHSISISRVAYNSQFTKVGGADAKGMPIIGRGYFDTNTDLPDPITGRGDNAVAYSFGAQIAEVEVDPDTGIVKILRYSVAHDVGRALNPRIVEGQLEGGLAQGLGYALCEEMVYNKDTGRLMNPGFTDYKIYAANDMPTKLDTIIVEEIDPNTPLGTKGVGEMALNPTAAALANAIYNAVGVRFTELPITAEKILKALKKKNARN
jgi:CO/xanthine dehydrogenase Mo-binding subunit